MSYGHKGPWNVHGTCGDTVVKWYSVDEGPLAEVICHGDVDPAWVADALNAAERPQAAICDPGQETR